MTSKLTFKVELQYFLDNKKVVFSNEICNDGLKTKVISIEKNKVIEKTINNRVLSGECLINGTKCGYTYIYDEDGTTIDLKKINDNISINESVNLITETKKSKDFYKAEINGTFALTNSSEFICTPSKNFIVRKEIMLSNFENTFTYLIQENFKCNGKTSKVENEEEIYQINQNYISLITDIKNNTKSIYCNIDNIEFDNIEENCAAQKKVQSIIEQLKPLKELLKSSPKNLKNLQIEIPENNKNKINR